MNGFLVIDKPGGMTSFDVVARARRFCGEKRCGHTGTLDPMATGILAVAVGRAAKFIQYLPDAHKRYRAEFILGVSTDTLDITGKVLERRELSVSDEEVAAAAESFVGVSEQLPPMYSAIRKNGERLYDLARKGIEVEREKREITVYSLTCSNEDGRRVLEVECSRGTYVRSLISDIGEKLGCPAVMSALRRLSTDGFDIESATTLEELENAARDGSVGSLLIPTGDAFSSLPAFGMSPAQERRFRNGGALDAGRVRFISDNSTDNIDDKTENGVFRALGADGFIGLGRLAGGSLTPLAVLDPV